MPSDNHSMQNLATKSTLIAFDILNDDSNSLQICADKALQEIKVNIAKCLQAGDLFISLHPWLYQLKCYLDRYGNMFSITDAICFIKLIYTIFATKYVDYEIVKLAADIGRMLFTSKLVREIPKSDLVLDWYPLYIHYKHILKKKSSFGFYATEDMIDTMSGVIKIMSAFFSDESFDAIWLEMRPFIVHHNAPDSYLLIHCFMPKFSFHYKFASNTWLPHLLSLLKLNLSKPNLESVLEMLWVMTYNFHDKLDLREHLPLLIDIVTSCLPFEDNTKKQNSYSKRLMANAIFMLMSAICPHHKGEMDPVTGLPMDPLAAVLSILHRLKPYLHVQMSDRNGARSLKVKIAFLMDTIASVTSVRLVDHYSHCWHASFGASDHFLLMPDWQVDMLVQELWSCYEVFFYHKHSIMLLERLVQLRPSFVIPKLLEEFYLSMATLHETPSRLEKSLTHIASIIPLWALACSDPDTMHESIAQPSALGLQWRHEGKKALFPFVEQILPLISAENLRITRQAIPIISKIIYWFPFKNETLDESNAAAARDQWTDEEREVLDLTVLFDDYFIDFIQRLCDLALHASSSMDIPVKLLKGSSLSSGMLIVPFKDICGISDPMKERIGRKLVEFYIENALSLTSVDYITMLITKFCDDSPTIANIYYPIVLDRIEAQIQEQHLCFNGETDQGLESYMNLLCYLRPASLHLHQDRIVRIFEQLFATTEVCVHKTVSILLGHLLMELLTSTLDRLPHVNVYECPWFSHRWSIFMPVEKVSALYGTIEPSLESVAFGLRLFQTFVVPDLQQLQQLLDAPPESTLPDNNLDDKFHCLLTHIYFAFSSLLPLLEKTPVEELLVDNTEGKYHCPPMLPLVPNSTFYRRLAATTGSLCMPDQTPIVQLLRQLVLRLWNNDSPQGFLTSGVLREVTLKRLLRLTDLAFHVPMPAMSYQQQSMKKYRNMAFRSRNRTVYQKVAKKLQQLKGYSRDENTWYLTPSLQQLCRRLVHCLFHHGPPVSGIAKEAISSMFFTKKLSICKFLLDELLTQLRANFDSIDHVVLLPFLQCLNICRITDCPNVSWLGETYFQIVIELLLHPSFVDSHHGLTNSFVHMFQAGIAQNFICKKVPSSIAQRCAAGRELNQLALALAPMRDDDPEQGAGDAVGVVEMLLQRRLHQLQTGFTLFIEKSRNFTLLNSRSVGAVLMNYYLKACLNFVQLNHLRACFAAAESQHISLISGAVKALIALLMVLRPKAVKVPCPFSNPDIVGVGHGEYLFEFDHSSKPPVDSATVPGVLANDETYSKFVGLSSLMPSVGLDYWLVDTKWKMPLAEEEFTQPSHHLHGNSALLWTECRLAFASTALWDGLKNLLLTKAAGEIHIVHRLLRLLLECFGNTFFTNILEVGDFEIKQLEENQAFPSKVGEFLFHLVGGLRLWPRQLRLLATQSLTSWLLHQQTLNNVWNMLEWKGLDTIQYLPVHQLLVAQAVTEAKLDTQHQLLCQYTYLSSLTNWKAHSTFSFFLTSMEEFLAGQQVHTLNIEMRSRLRQKFAKKVYIFDTCRYDAGTIAASHCSLDQWLASFLLPCLAYHVHYLLDGRQQMVSDATRLLAEQWSGTLHPNQQEVSVQDSQETLRIIFMLFNFCGSHHPTFWKAIVIVADLLPCLPLFPGTETNAKNLFHNAKLYYSVTGVAASECMQEALQALLHHPSPLCRKMFLTSLGQMITYRAACYLSPTLQQSTGEALFTLLQDPDESVRQEARTFLARLIRVGYLKVTEHVLPGIAQLQKATGSGKKKRRGGGSSADDLWPVVAAHCALLEAHPDQMLDFIPDILLKVCIVADHRDRKVSSMARQQLSNFKHASKTIWPLLLQSMSADDAALVNDCARSNAYYYV